MPADDQEHYFVPLYLLCAEDNEVALVRVIDELHREGYSPEVVSGVDVDSVGLAAAIDRAHGTGLFVLCQSDELDRTHVRRLTGLFSARRGPDQRIITVMLHPTRPLSILPAVREGMKALADARYERTGGEDGDRTHLRDVVGPTSVSAVGPRIHDREAIARRLHDEMVATEATLSRRGNALSGIETRLPDLPDGTVVPREEEERTERRVARKPPPPPPKRFRSTHPPPPPPMPRNGRGEASEDEPWLDLLKGPPIALRDDPFGHEAPASGFEDAAPLRPVEVGESGGHDPDRDAPTDPGSRVVVDPGPLASLPRVVARQRSPREPERSRVGLVLGVAVVAVTGGSYLGARALAAGRAEDSSVPVRAPVAPGPARTPETVSPRPALAETPSKPSHASAASERESTVVIVDETPPPPPVPTRDPEAIAIERALAAGRLRKVGDLLMATPGTEDLRWSSASDECRSLRIGNTGTTAGIGGFSLPTERELQRLYHAKVLPVGMYWTRSRTDEGDEAAALDTESGRVNIYLLVEPAARTVCIRKAP